MKLNSNEYQIECTPDGEYYAFLTDYHQCCTYGETAEEALETLSDIAATNTKQNGTTSRYLSNTVCCRMKNSATQQ